MQLNPCAAVQRADRSDERGFLNLPLEPQEALGAGTRPSLSSLFHFVTDYLENVRIICFRVGGGTVSKSVNVAANVHLDERKSGAQLPCKQEKSHDANIILVKSA